MGGRKTLKKGERGPKTKCARNAWLRLFGDRARDREVPPGGKNVELLEKRVRGGMRKGEARGRERKT